MVSVARVGTGAADAEHLLVVATTGATNVDRLEAFLWSRRRKRAVMLTSSIFSVAVRVVAAQGFAHHGPCR